MNEPIDNEYFNWLCAKVLEKDGRIYYQILGILYKTEFIWIVPDDENRAIDGLDLRHEFLRQTRTGRDPDWEKQPCSVLEMLITFSRRASFQTEISTRKWFWEIMSNLKLNTFTVVSDSDIPAIQNILHRFLWRKYSRHGDGGMFPISVTNNDQREVEIWYQFCEYANELGLY